MWIWTPDDVEIFKLLAKECSSEGEEEETIRILNDGFSLYSEEAISKLRRTYNSWEEFFRDRYKLLLENIGFAGQTCESAFGSKTGRDLLCRMVRSCGVPSYDVEDIVQEIFMKWWRVKWVERYNPLISSWRNFLMVPIRRSVDTYNLRKSKKVMTYAFRLDGFDDDDEMKSYSLYDFSQDQLPEDNMIRQEVMEDWESFLRSQPPIRTAVRRRFNKMCTMLPPGILEIPTDGEMTLFFLQGGYYNSRVTSKELYEDGISIMVPNQLLVDYISEDPVTHIQCIDKVTGDFITQKDYPSPNFDCNTSGEINDQRTWMDFYTLIMRGLQIEEISCELRMVPPSIPARIKKLESLFRDFWLISKKITGKSKLLAAQTYQCPRCFRLDLINRDECTVCGTDMKSEVAMVRFNAYPWNKVHITIRL